MYKGNFEAWGKIGRAEGIRGIYTGWGPTFFGYSVSFVGVGIAVLLT
jgi:solute carrier family 25 phosphate transporter 3